jgi:hypothetical protein
VGKGRHQQQEREVQEQQRPVHAAEPVEEGVVVDPDDADGAEADDVGGVVGPLRAQRAQQARAHVRHVQVEHQQRDGDREHAIAEGLRARRDRGH